MTDRIKEFLARNQRGRTRASSSTSKWCATTTRALRDALPDTRVFYAVKANPAPEILEPASRPRLVASTPPRWSRSSWRWRLARSPERVSFGNTIKKETRYRAGLCARASDLFAVDCESEVEKIARAAPGSKVFCRILCDGAGAEWPLSRKFGCAPEMAAAGARARPCASASSRMGCRSMSARSRAIRGCGTARSKRRRRFSRDLAERGIQLSMINLGGGFPTRYLKRRASRSGPTGRRSSVRFAAPFRQPHPRDDHRARSRHGRQRRDHRS